MKAADRIQSARNRIAKANKTIEMYNQRNAKIFKMLSEHGVTLTEDDIVTNMDHAMNLTFRTWSIVESKRKEINYYTACDLTRNAEARYKKQREVEADQALIERLEREAKQREADQAQKQESQASLKQCLTQVTEPFKTVWFERQQEYFSHHYDAIRTQAVKVRAHRERARSLAIRLSHECVGWSVIHTRMFNMLKRVTTTYGSSVIADQANRYRTKGEYLCEYIIPMLVSDWRTCIDILTDKCQGFGLNEDKITAQEPQVTSKGFEIFLEDGSDRRVFARIIWVAENSKLVRPHTRYIVTERKMKK